MQPFIPQVLSRTAGAAWRLVTLPHRVTISVVRTGFEMTGGIPAGLIPLLGPVTSRRVSGQTATRYPFLSEEWISKVREIRESYRGKTAKPPVVRINHVIRHVPFTGGDVHAYLDSTSGELEMDLGLLDDADLEVEIDYASAKDLIVGLDIQKAMTAFMQGELKISGDMSKLMALQTTQVDPVALRAAAEIQAITI